MVNYSNFALAQTKYQVVVKLDDDHIAIPAVVDDITSEIRANRLPPATLWAFSGLNLARDDSGRMGILAHDPLSGNGDIAYFRLSHRTYFKKDRRFERFNRNGMKLEFKGFAYWHMKYLKTGNGFKNYDLALEADSRFHLKQRQFENQRELVFDYSKQPRLTKPSVLDVALGLVSTKARYRVSRARWLANFSTVEFPDLNILKKSPRPWGGGLSSLQSYGAMATDKY
jgi:hypothetical protein